ncbi:MAG: ABC transporter permease subunit, partial [Acetobacteraceae bacterium]
MSVAVRPVETAIRSPLSEFWRRFRGKHVPISAGVVLGLIVLASVLAPWVAPYSPSAPDYLNLLAGPSWAHPFGTDAYGRDILSRVIWGGRISLSIGVISVAAGGAAGVLLGLISGYAGGWVDSLVMRFCDVLLAFPGILLAIGIVAVLGPGVSNVIWAVAVFSVPVFARLVRGSTLGLKQTVYVQAARSIGVPRIPLVLRHILP